MMQIMALVSHFTRREFVTAGVLYLLQQWVKPALRACAALQAQAALHLGAGCLCMFFCWGALLVLQQALPSKAEESDLKLQLLKVQ
jgi:hypothetical protein